MDNFCGKRLDGRYEIKEIIGVGGMAVVYKAYDNIDDRIVAVKILKEEFLANEEFRRRFPSIDEYIIYKLSSGNAALPAVNGNKPLREHAPIKSITDIKRFFTGPLDIIREALQKYWGNGNSMR